MKKWTWGHIIHTAKANAWNYWRPHIHHYTIRSFKLSIWGNNVLWVHRLIGQTYDYSSSSRVTMLQQIGNPQNPFSLMLTFTRSDKEQSYAYWYGINWTHVEWTQQRILLHHTFFEYRHLFPFHEYRFLFCLDIGMEFLYLSSDKPWIKATITIS